jgi:hypothetical protein
LHDIVSGLARDPPLPMDDAEFVIVFDLPIGVRRRERGSDDG